MSPQAHVTAALCRTGAVKARLPETPLPWFPTFLDHETTQLCLAIAPLTNNTQEILGLESSMTSRTQGKQGN
jgi:hypothetical protein